MIWKMLIFFLISFFCEIRFIVCMDPTHQTPAAQKLWSQPCRQKTMVLNDCNWCRCTNKMTYSCDSMTCGGVDMFGHFNDAIRDLDPGMEGHGAWRSGETACEPGVNYRKSGTLCICGGDGSWPNPVCRDLFQILHSVEVTDHLIPDVNQTCLPNKLHLVGCNVCYCSAKGVINPDMCTKKNCSSDSIVKTKEDLLPEEVYAVCDDGIKYQVGCQSCTCLRNNRLLCAGCTEELRTKSICSDYKPDEYFIKDCNYCYCDKKDTIYCTAKKCLPLKPQLIAIPKIDHEPVNPPTHNINCVPGTQYKQNCNTCFCFLNDGIKYYACTIDNCQNNVTATPVYHWENCVENTMYEVNNLICECSVQDGVKREFCYVGEHVKYEEKSPLSLDSMHGYCEPLHYYEQDCNKCRCLADGKTVACTSKTCKDKKDTDIVEIVPFLQNETHCPKGHKYTVDCNVCYCLANGNALCSANKCS